MRIFGALAGGVTGMGAMSVPQLSEAQTLPPFQDAMKLHLATWPPDKQEEQSLVQATAQRMKPTMRLRILISYHYYRDADLDELFGKYFTQPYPEVFADSGGFSAMTQGAQINWQEYVAWVKRWKHLLTVYANLDVIGNAKQTEINQKRLEDAGLAPLPVFHTGSPFSVLEQMIEQYAYIALGGMVPHMRFSDRIVPWVIQCFKRAKGKAVFHGFGATSWAILRSFPWYSVDSSSWGQGFRFGQVPLFDESKGQFVKIGLGEWKECQKHAKLFRNLGFDWQDFADRKRNDRAKICAISALSYMMAEQWLRKRHGEVHIPHRPDIAPGLVQYLADANPERFGDAIQGAAGVRLHLADTSNGVNLGDADKGIKIHLADAKGNGGGEITAADAGIKLHLAEHSLDRGG